MANPRCWWCCPASERWRYPTRGKCENCVGDEGEGEATYTADLVLWSLSCYLEWQETGSHPPERSDLERALDWLKEDKYAFTPLEREAILVRWIEGSSLKHIASYMEGVSESAVTQAGLKGAEKIADWLNGGRK